MLRSNLDEISSSNEIMEHMCNIFSCKLAICRNTIKLISRILKFAEYIGLEKKLFVSCNGPKRNRAGRSVKNLFFIISLVKNVCLMHV